MARKTLTYQVPDEGRDFGKQFLITELPASRAENWATRAILALLKGGVEIPDGFENLGMAGMAELGIRALENLDFDLAEPLLDEMFECVQFIPDSSKTHLTRKLVETDIEEIMTRIVLRTEVWKLHADFSKAVGPLASAQKRTVKTVTPNI